MKTLNFSKYFDKRYLMIYLGILMFITIYIKINYQIDLIMIVFGPILVVYTSHYFGKKRNMIL